MNDQYQDNPPDQEQKNMIHNHLVYLLGDQVPEEDYNIANL